MIQVKEHEEHVKNRLPQQLDWWIVTSEDSLEVRKKIAHVVQTLGSMDLLFHGKLFDEETVQYRVSPTTLVLLGPVNAIIFANQANAEQFLAD